MKRKPIRRVLVSLSDKAGLLQVAAALVDHGAEIVATSSTATALEDLGFPVTEVSALTGFPEILGGRVKTLHPAIHAGLLARQDVESDLDQLADVGIAPFDAIVVNLYPFGHAVQSGANFDQCVEQIDIGGPTMVRAAAKNFPHVATVTSPDQYPTFIEQLRAGGLTLAERGALATQAFQMMADYDVAIATWLTNRATNSQGSGLRERTSDSRSPDLPGWLGETYRQKMPLRYGENPHQSAALYIEASGTDDQPSPAGLANAHQLGGKELSYNNLQDTDAALSALHGFSQPTVAIIKHANPCGIASAPTLAAAYRNALACDPLSAFGSVVALNREVDLETADKIARVFTEVVAAPRFTVEALQVLQTKPSLRILEVQIQPEQLQFRQISGGLLVQTADFIQDSEDPANWTLVAGEPVSSGVLADLDFAWRAVKSVKSNAILLAKGQATVGVGMGQVNRVDAARLAVERANTLGPTADDSASNNSDTNGETDAGADTSTAASVLPTRPERARGSVAASDAFFPFPDGLEVLADAGVVAVVSPGGSKRDPEVIAAAQEAGVSLYFTGVRHFWH